MENTNKIWDLIIVGAGPSALTAAIYTAREDISTLLIEKGVVGGLMATIDKIENYPGFTDGIEGFNLAADFQGQAERFGAKIELAEVQKISRDDKNVFEVTTDGETYRAKTVLIATGCSYRHIGVPNEDRASYCATCDGAFYRGKKLVIVGGANAAVQEAMFLTKFATHIDLLVRSHIKASEILQKELQEFLADGRISLHEGVTPDEIIVEDNHVVGVRAHQTDDTAASQTFDCDGVFILAGVIPSTEFLKDSDVKLDDVGHILTDKNLMTTVPGIFASGDCRSGAAKQVTVAAGEGTTAALNIREYLSRLDKQ